MDLLDQIESFQNNLIWELYLNRKIIKHGKLEEITEAQLEAKMKQILTDYEPLLNAQVVEGESIEAPKSSESSSHKPKESLSDPQKLKTHPRPDRKKQKA